MWERRLSTLADSESAAATKLHRLAGRAGTASEASCFEAVTLCSSDEYGVCEMIYALPVLILTMLGYMFWSSVFRLRRERLRAVKSSDRSGVILTPRHRARANLTRAFVLPAQRAEWEAGLLANLRNREGE